MVINLKASNDRRAEDLVFWLLYHRIEFAGYGTLPNGEIDPAREFPTEALIRPKSTWAPAGYHTPFDIYVDIPDDELAVWFKLKHG